MRRAGRVRGWTWRLAPCALVLLLGLAASTAAFAQARPGAAQPAAPPSPDPDASVFEDVDECDLLAAHPNDPERLAEGVADDQIIPRLAMRACEAALRRQPNEARFVFQLGRALLAADRRQQAAQQFERAAQLNYGAGLAYLGDAFQFGHGVTANAARALELYRRALERGFKPAEGQIEMLTFDPARFTNELPALLFRGETAPFADATSPASTLYSVYLFGFVSTLVQECQALLPPAVMFPLLIRRYPDGWTPEVDVRFDVMRAGPAAEFDARAFVRRHGCDGPVAREMAGRITRFLLLP